MKKKIIVLDSSLFQDGVFFVTGITSGEEVKMEDVLISKRNQVKYKVVGIGTVPAAAYAEGKRVVLLRPLSDGFGPEIDDFLIM